MHLEFSQGTGCQGRQLVILFWCQGSCWGRESVVAHPTQLWLSAMFIDQAVISVQAGKGGDGCVSFYRARALPKGGPDGGDGGDGGSLIAKSDENVNTLLDFRGVHHWSAQKGGAGQGKQRHGKNGEDCTLLLPSGTLIFNEETGELIHDLKPDEEFVLIAGGKGGFGNEHFKSSTNQAPRKATPGGEGLSLTLRLELELIADVGIVGLPNASKSTLLSAQTRAAPKVADYPFTTLSPQLGIAELDSSRRLVLADIPGLIEGAADGAGLGHDFLRHIERTSVLVHVLDVVPVDGSDPARNYEMIRQELEGYSPLLAQKPEILALNKMDLLPDDVARLETMNRIKAALELNHGHRVVGISGATGLGLKELLESMWDLVHPRREPADGWPKR